MRSDIKPGQTSEYLGFDLVMDDTLPEPCVLLADCGYDADNVRKTMGARNVMPIFPMRKTRKLRVAHTTCTTASSAASSNAGTHHAP